MYKGNFFCLPISLALLMHVCYCWEILEMPYLFARVGRRSDLVRFKETIEVKY